ncbi:ATP-binding protein [Magnetospirillum sp. UT-4]|uniref:sensor histidine kinase n=1 Tax=Magnetospirillum sp. UT-4 TaxID=2681467 RepID=UPI0013832BD1
MRPSDRVDLPGAASVALPDPDPDPDALAAMVEELRRSNAELEQFAHVVSHDLREPLRMVSSYAQLLARRYGDSLDEDGRTFIHFITDGAARMERLIEDILDFSRAGAATRLEAFPAARAVDAALDDLGPVMAEHRAAIRVAPLPEVVADETGIERLFANLIGNAVKYRRPDLAPTIVVTGEECAEGWHFAVADNGEGIAPEDHERIFMVFARLHGRDRPGTGLGLPICRKIVERHGGRLWVDSRPGHGSTFHFTLRRP